MGVTIFNWFKRQPQITALAILLIGFALTVHQLDFESIWVDEGATIAIARGDTTNILPTQSEAGDYNPPLPYLLWHFWIPLAGLSEFSIRFVSVMAATVAVALCYRMGERLFNPAIGLVASLLLVSSGFHIYYAQTVRAYSLLEMFALLSWFSALGLYRRPNLNWTLIYILGNVGFLYTHYYGVFVLLSQSLFFTVQLVRQWPSPRPEGWDWLIPKVKSWLIPQTIIASGFLPWIPVLLSQTKQAVTVIEPLSVGLLVGTFLEYTWSPVAFIIAICLLVVGAYALLRPAIVARLSGQHPARKLQFSVGNSEGILVVLIWFCIALGVPILISLLFKPVFLSRYAITALPAFYLLITWLAVQIIRRSVSFLLISLLVLGQLSGVYFLYQNVNNDQWREAVHYLDLNTKPGDLLIFYAGIGQFSYQYYSQFPDLPHAQLGVSEGPAKAQALLSAEQPQTVWLVLAYHSKAEFDQVMNQMGYTLLDQQDFFRITLAKYQK